MFFTVTAAATVAAGWATLAFIDLDSTPVALSLQLHNLVLAILTTATVAVILGELYRRRLAVFRSEQEAAPPTESAGSYAQGVVDGLRLGAARSDDGPTVDLAPAVGGGNVTLLRPRIR